MARRSTIQLFTNLDPYRTYANLLKDEQVGDLDQSEKGLICFSLKSPGRVRVRLTPKGYIQLDFDQGANLVDEYRTLERLGVPMNEEKFFAIFPKTQLSKDMEDHVKILRNFIRRGFELPSNPALRDGLRTFLAREEALWKTAVSLVSLVLWLNGITSDSKEVSMERIYTIIMRTYEEALRGPA